MINKPIRISKEVLKELKLKKEKNKLKSYDAVLEKLLKSKKKGKMNGKEWGF